MGPERKSRIPDEEANLITAYHEGGHTIVAHYTQDAHPLHKVNFKLYCHLEFCFVCLLSMLMLIGYYHTPRSFIRPHSLYT